MSPTQCILASRSPRRALLLKREGIAFIQVEPTFQDPPSPQPEPGQTAEQFTVATASHKVRCLIGCQVDEATSDAVILAADTVVVAPDGVLLGTPQTLDQAHQMLQCLIGRTHHVVTGVALMGRTGRPLATFADRCAVALGEIDPAELHAYLQSHAWQGKAGGYNLAELKDQWPFTVTGDPTTVIGLPMRRLMPYLSPHQPPNPSGADSH